MKNEVNIGISGYAGTGKSTVALIVVKALSDAGFKNILLHDSDSNEQDNLDSRISSLVDNLKINIGTHQTMRSSIDRD